MIGPFPENYDISKHSSCKVADRSPQQCRLRYQPNCDAEADLIPAFAERREMPRGTVAEIEHTLIRKTHVLCPEIIMHNEIICSVLMS
jgi:hypothetical protein